VAWTADHRGSTPPKSFFESLPRELKEAARIDGLGWFGHRALNRGHRWVLLRQGL
jgi:hypothetical protein